MSEEKLPTLSVIVPIYNCEKFLPTCIKSIITSKVENLELILVDDGSTDRSLEIAREFSHSDKRITVLSQENSGPSAARNRGLDNARGKWISFIDADDWISEEYFKIIPTTMEYDLIYFGHYNVYSSKYVPQRITRKDTSTNNIDATLLSLLTSPELFFGFTCNKFYQRKLIGNLRFKESLHYKEDEVFTIEYCRHVRSLYISSKLPYYYRISSTSLSHDENKIRNYFDLGTLVEQSLSNYPWVYLKRELLSRCNIYYLLGIEEIISNNSIEFNEKKMTLQHYWSKYDQFCIANRSIEILGKRQWVLSFCPFKYFRQFLRLKLLLKTYGSHYE